MKARRMTGTADFRGANGVQPDGRIEPAADRAAKKHGAQKRARTRRPARRR